MGSNLDMNALEERLTCFLHKLQAESGILERMVYKNKNQHRRCSYFKYLLKVRRDLRLLQSIRLDEIVRFCFLVIVGDRPKQKVHLLESLKRRKSDSGKYNFLERLLGAARLLSRMVEPMLKTATEVSVLFAQSFFMGFSLTIMALLARLRVLVQQILLDTVQLFNTVSSLARRKQSIKINQEGIEVFREFYPIHEDFITLECVWESDKFLLLETMQTRKPTCEDGDSQEKIALCGPAVIYETIESFLTDISEEVKSEFDTKVDPLNIMRETTDVLMRSLPSDNEKMSESCDGELTGKGCSLTTKSTPCGDTLKVHLSSYEVTSDEGSTVGKCGLGVIETPRKELPAENGLTAAAKSSSGGKFSRLSSSSKDVAFVSIKNPRMATTNAKDLTSSSRDNTFDLMKNRNSEDREDTFFHLLTGGIVKDSLF